MTALSNEHVELRGLIADLREQTLSAEQASRLNGLLSESSDARDVFVRYTLLQASLELSGSDATACDVVEDSSLSVDSILPERPYVVVQPESVYGSYSGVRSFIDTPMFSYLVSMAICCAMLFGAWAHKVSHFQQVGPQIVKTPTGLDRLSPELVGRITGMKDCRWTDPSNRGIIGPSVRLERKFDLASGLLEITYITGAKVILEGPCTYTINSRDGGYLDRGKLTARVDNAKLQAANHKSSSLIPRPSSFFTVTTPTAVVTDMGTEFGVEVGADGSTTSHVFCGSVRVQAVGDDRRKNVILRANESARVEKTGVEGQPPITRLDTEVASRFVLEMPPPQTTRDSRAYAELVLSLNPAAYYRMEQPSDTQDRRVVVDSAPGSHHGELRLGDNYGGSPHRSGRFGGAIWFRGSEVGDRVIVSDYKKAENDRLTVAAWVMATGRPGWAMIAANWGTPREGREDTDNAGQFHIGLYRADGDLCARVMQRNGKWIQVREGAENPLPTGVWQHVAMVVDEGVLRLYRNGDEVASTPCDGLLAQPPIDALGIGCRLDSTGKKAPRGTRGYHYWQGRIDELAVFNEALPVKTIRRLYLGKKVNGQTEAASVGKGESPMDGP